MKRFVKACLIICIVTIIFSACTKNRAGLDNISMEPRRITVSSGTQIEELAPLVAPAVVGISAGSGYKYSIGSGVAIKTGGYVLTNSHVVMGNNNVTLHLADGTTASAKVILDNENADLALLKCSVDIPYLEIEATDSIKVGQEIIAIGTPLDLEFTHSVTAGIISALDRKLSVEENGGIATFTNLIQHDASINPGNSGGPIINLSGKIVGINTLKVDNAEGMGFAICGDDIVEVLSSYL